MKNLIVLIAISFLITACDGTSLTGGSKGNVSKNSGFTTRDGTAESVILGSGNQSQTIAQEDLPEDCPVVDLVASNGNIMIGGVFWPVSLDAVTLKADGNGYFLTHYDLALLGITGAYPCDTLAAQYGYMNNQISGQLQMEIQNKDKCGNFIYKQAYWAVITEDSRYPGFCDIQFASPK